MRKFYFVFLCLCLIKFASANVLTTCPDGTYPAQFTGLQAAHDAASDGDTIYVYPGNYFNGVVLQFTKRLVLIGPGLSPMRPDGRPALLDVLQAKTAASSGSVLSAETLSNCVSRTS